MSNQPTPSSSSSGSETPGRFGEFGGCFVPEVLRPAIEELTEAYERLGRDDAFRAELATYAKTFVGRPTPLHFARNLTKHLGGAKVFIKMEGLAHTGAHKINNSLGQALLARKMGKTRLIAETGAGQHGLATATAAAVLGLECEVFMGVVDARRQYPNVFWMEQAGTTVRVVDEGTGTLKDAVNATMKHWTERIDDTHYIIGSALGPHPYPTMVRDFQSVIGCEVRRQLNEEWGESNVACVVACVGGGSNSIGIFDAFRDETSTRLIGVEAGGRGEGAGENAVRMSGLGRTGIVQAYKSFFLLDEGGQVLPTHSVSAGLDYPGIGPELAHLGMEGRVEFAAATDQEALDAVSLLMRHEGIVAALESAHAIAHATKVASTMASDEVLVVNLSGRGDKDLFITAKHLAPDRWKQFLADEIREMEGRVE